MKILWICTSPLGPMAKMLGIDYGGSSGGWITSEFERLKDSDCEIAFLTMHSSVKKRDITEKTNGRNKLYCICAPKPTFGIDVPEWMKENVLRVYEEYDPDIVQIWGTESVLSHAAAVCDTKAEKIIFLQGILGIHVRHKRQCLGGDRVSSPRYRLTERLKRRLYEKQADLEARSLKAADAVILDNDFSQAYCADINPDLKSIRYQLVPKQCFFFAGQNNQKKEPYSIFTLAGNSAMKGMHQLLRVISSLKPKYPDIKLYIPGNFSGELKAMGKKQPKGYEHLLYRIIKENGIENNVVFCGYLTPEKMAEAMSRCVVFVNSSCMEVHALSLREAMAAGLACVSTECGSVAEFLHHGENGFLYRYGEPEVCAYYVSKIFDDVALAEKLSNSAAATWCITESQTLAKVYEEYART